MKAQIGLLFAVLLCLISASARADIVNFENSESLEKALRADPAYAPDRAAASRAVAESAYLEYLKTAKDSGQRAKVYFNLCHMFCAGARTSRDEPKDLRKAREYCKAVLKECPDGVCKETLWARTMLASLAPTMEQRVELEIEAYKFLKKIDKDYLAKHLILDRPLPEVPKDAAKPDRGAIEQQRKWRLKNANAKCSRLVKSTTDNVVYCAIFEARACKSPELVLSKIVREFPPGDKLRQSAAKALQDMEEIALAGVTEERVKSLAETPKDMGEPASPSARGPDPEGPTQAAVSPPTARTARSDSGPNWSVVLGVTSSVLVLAVVAGGAMFWHKRRRTA